MMKFDPVGHSIYGKLGEEILLPDVPSWLKGLKVIDSEDTLLTWNDESLYICKLSTRKLLDKYIEVAGKEYSLKAVAISN